MHGSRLRPYLGPLIALLVVLAIGAGTVYAAIPNQGTYYACLTKSTGEIKVINYPKVKCARGQQLIKWAQQGPQGVQGPQGAQGPAGPADWNAIPNIPAGFADGTDNEGVTAVKVTYKRGDVASLNGGGNGYATVRCPAGSFAIGGGFTQDGFDIKVTDSFAAKLPNPPWNNDPATWVVYGMNTAAAARNLYAVVTCLEVTPASDLTVATRGVTTANAKNLSKKRGH